MTPAAARAVLCATILFLGVVGAAVPAGLDDLYTADAIVTGRSGKTRQLGFEDCLHKVVVRVVAADGMGYFDGAPIEFRVR